MDKRYKTDGSLALSEEPSATQYFMEGVGLIRRTGDIYRIIRKPEFSINLGFINADSAEDLNRSQRKYPDRPEVPIEKIGMPLEDA